MIREIVQYPHVAFGATFGLMKAPEIRARLKDSGRSQAALARAIGKSKDSVSRLLNNARGMDVDEAEKIDAFFGVGVAAQPAYLRLPVFGYAAAGGEDRVALADDQVLDHVEIPRGLVRGEAFGVRVAGESMYPRLQSGETVIAERGVAPIRNKEVLVELRDGSGLVKEYRGQKDGFLFLWQYNPEREVRIELSKVRTMCSAFRWR